MGVHEDLVAARALIDTPEKWHKGSYHDMSGKCHCAMGAVLVATQAESPYEPRVSACRNALQIALGGMVTEPIGLFNDRKTTTHADVMALFDRAIAANPSTDKQEGGR